MPEIATAVATERTCSRIDPSTDQKCGAALTNKHAWCKDCQAKYKAEYSALVPGMYAVRGFAKGVEALRAVLIQKFDLLGSGCLSGTEAADWIETEPAPRLEPEA